MNFSSALLICTPILTAIYLTLLLVGSKAKQVHSLKEKLTSTRILLFVAYSLAGLLVIIKVFWEYSILYFFLIPVIVGILVLVISRTSNYRNYVLALIIFIHLIVISLLFPQSGLFITERTPALIRLDEAKMWNTEWEILNPYYNPFPMEQGVYYVLSQMSTLSYDTYFFTWFINVVFVIGYDLTLFSIAKKLSGNWQVGCLAVFLLSFTPPLLLNTQPQWLGNIFAMLFMFGLLKALKDSPSVASMVLLNLSYAVAIIFHGTAAIGLVFVFILILVMLFGRKVGLNLSTTRPQRSFVYSVFVSTSLLTLGRWIMLGGVSSIINPLDGLYKNIFGRIETGWIGAEYTPLYDQYASPLSAYAWSIPISLVITFVFYHLITHKQTKSVTHSFSLSMGIAAAGLSIVGFLGSMFMAHGNLQRYVGYSGMSLFIPVAALVCYKILRSASVKGVSVGLISLILFSGIAVYDPAFSPELYRELETVNPTTSVDLIEVATFYSILPDGTRIISTYEILTGVWYWSMLPESPNKTITGYASSLKTHRLIVEQLVEEHKILAGVTYIWSPELLESIEDIPINVIYTSGRHVAVRR